MHVRAHLCAHFADAIYRSCLRVGGCGVQSICRHFLFSSGAFIAMEGKGNEGNGSGRGMTLPSALWQAHRQLRALVRPPFRPRGMVLPWLPNGTMASVALGQSSVLPPAMPPLRPAPFLPLALLAAEAAVGRAEGDVPAAPKAPAAAYVRGPLVKRPRLSALSPSGRRRPLLCEGLVPCGYCQGRNLLAAGFEGGRGGDAWDHDGRVQCRPLGGCP